MKVCIGGTFSPFHKGHKDLIKKACEIAGSKGTVFIGITSDELAQKKGINTSYETRKKYIEQFLSKQHATSTIIIQPLYDAYGPSIEGDYDAIVVSPETKTTAEKINRKRKEQQKKSLQIIVIPFELAEDHQPISSTRIRRKEIDENGTILTQK